MVSQALGITDFAFEGKAFRVVRNGELWFVLADVCQALELTHSHKTAERLDQDEKGSTTIPTPGGPQEMLIISEPGLYKLIATSRKPVAVRFDRWVRHEVLPSIRKTGAYGLPSLMPPAQMQAVFEQTIDRKLDPLVREMRDGFREMRTSSKRVEDNVVELVTKGRKNADAETVRMHGKVIRHHFDNKCPCCECNITIMDNDGFIPGVWHHHHQFNRNDNRPTAMIPLAVKCHQRIETDAEARTRFGAKAWIIFQTLLERLPVVQMKLDLRSPP